MGAPASGPAGSGARRRLTRRCSLRAARGPLGPLTARALAVEQRLDGLPGAPPGEYVVRQYHSVYGGKKAVVETLTLRREAGAWRVAGYFVR